MPAFSWSLPSVGDTDLRGLRDELHRQRAVAQHEREVVRLLAREVSADRDVLAGDAGVDRRRRLHHAVELDRDLLAHVRGGDLGDEVVVLEVDVHRPGRGRGVDDRGGGSDVVTR